MEERTTSFPALLEEFRALRNISKTELAKLANLTPGYVSHLTRGERISPSEEAVRALAEALELSAEMRARFFKAAGYPLRSGVMSLVPGKSAPSGNNARIGGSEIPDPGNFYGRQEELQTLSQWVVADRCRVLATLGIGGIGKTALVARLVMQIKDGFSCVFWRSLSEGPSVENVLVECIQFLSNQAPIDFPADEESHLPLLLDTLSEYMRKERSLIILDNFESILQSGESAGSYREKYEGYGKLIQRVGTAQHQSCLVLTSREKPQEIAQSEGDLSPIRSRTLQGLSVQDGRDLVHDKGLFGKDEVWSNFIERYSGNPLALKLIAEPIREVFGGDIAAFLREEEAVFESLRNLLEQQFQRLSAIEKVIMYWLAIEREPVSLEDLQDDILPPVTKKELLEALTSLRRRSFINNATGTARFDLQPVIMEYIIDNFVTRIFEEIKQEKPHLLGSHALIKAYAKNYVRNGQKTFILNPLAVRLRAAFGREKSEDHLRSIFTTLRETKPAGWEYVPGNLLHLLMQLEIDLHSYDFSHLLIRQAYLQGVTLAGVNFSHTTFRKSVFTDTFGKVLSVAMSPDGKLLAAGLANSEIRLWQLPGSAPLLTFQGHSDWVRSIAFSPNGKFLISGSEDRTLRLWEVSTGRCLRIFQGHSSWVYSVAFSPDEKLVASGSDDQTVRLWEVESGRCVKVLQGHSSWVYSVAFSPDGRLLASGSDDQTVRLWEVESGSHRILYRHSDKVWSVAFSPDGRLLASGSYDQTVRLWDVEGERLHKVLSSHSDKVWSVAFSPDGKVLASGSHDQTVRLWEVESGLPTRILRGHSSWIYSMVFSSDGNLLISGSDDQTVRFWETNTGECLNTLQGYSNEIWSITFSPDKKFLASGSDDRTVCLWDAATGGLLKELRGHSNRVRCVAFSPDSQLLISGSDDQTVRIWKADTGECLNTLQVSSTWIWSVTCSLDGRLLATGSDDHTIRLWDIATGRNLNVLSGHEDWVWSVAFNPNSQLLVSGSDDQTVRIWEVATGNCLNVLQGHESRVRAVAFSPKRDLVASGSDDQTVSLWNANTGEHLSTFPGHSNWVRTVTFSPDGKLLASGSDDQIVRLWDINTGECLKILKGHTQRVRSVVFSPDSQLLVSGSQDGTIRFWDVGTGECLQILRTKKPYDRMNITEVKGLSYSQKKTLKDLGAIEEHEVIG